MVMLDVLGFYVQGPGYLGRLVQFSKGFGAIERVILALHSRLCTAQGGDLVDLDQVFLKVSVVQFESERAGGIFDHLVVVGDLLDC